MTPLEPNICPACGAAIPPEAPAGQCVRCALNLVLEPPPGNLEPADMRIGSYQVLEKLGEGGMGIVWKARDLKLGRVVALKQIQAGCLAKLRDVERFRLEMETVARLDHPHIVPVYEAGEHRGHAYCVMRYIEGGSLAGRLTRAKTQRKGWPDREEAARLIAIVARAVHHAHQHGVIHRDLKPSNILLDSAGQPHLADFGLAKRLDADCEHTVSGAILGSLHYLAPEQAAANSRHLTTGADVYGLGAVLYELLAGRPPFEAKDITVLLRKIAEADPEPPLTTKSEARNPQSEIQTADRDTPLIRSSRFGFRISDLSIICLKCLAKEPARRYASAADLADDLERWLRREPIMARPPTLWERAINAVRRHPVRAGLAGVALLAVALTATFFYASQRTYLWLMAKIADEHLVVPPREDGTFRLALTDETGPRCSNNFWKMPFGSYYSQRTPNGRFARLEFTGVPPEVAGGLQVQVWSDVPGYPDLPRSPELTNGAIFKLDIGQRRERAYYFAEVNFAASNILARFPDAALRVILLGRPADADPYRPAGALEPRERQ